ncbi:hypothetical protein MKEN_00487500 [Mycena kentingensis (nom. inval.)]|nr:hypothetical protein MKEN_00487500 [Mycena kentingensis (nom. inval.)]
MPPRKAFSESSAKLVLGIDLGTMYSGISFSILEPGKVPTILPVTRFPPQEHIGGDSKVRSLAYYDSAGIAKALGAEALQESVEEQAEVKNWNKAEWFKLHLRPATVPIDERVNLPPLPSNKTAIEVFADFLRYLYACARSYITEHYGGGSSLWIKLQDTTEFILTHPNAWDGEQQAQMRRAAIIAGLVPDTANGHNRIRFVTEGEASLHFCLLSGLAINPLKRGKGVIIVDAGGGTVDISAYRKISTLKGDSFEEIARPACLMEGSIFVTRRAKEYLTGHLRNSKFSGDVDHITECFDKTTKLKFLDPQEWSYVKFGRPRDKDEEYNIVNGQMKISGEVVSRFFQPAVTAIVKAVYNLVQGSQVSISNVLLVGGFAASEWLTSELKRILADLGLEVSRPDSHVNKAVSDGAVSFYIDHFVSSRVSKRNYGIEVRIPYVPADATHRDVRVAETKEFRESYFKTSTSRTDLGRIQIELLRYAGSDDDVKWMDKPADFLTLCKISADTTSIARNLKPQQSRPGESYYILYLEVVLSFGLTELKAEIAWKNEKVSSHVPSVAV